MFNHEKRLALALNKLQTEEDVARTIVGLENDNVFLKGCLLMSMLCTVLTLVALFAR